MNTQKIKELNSEIIEKENRSYIIIASSSLLYAPIMMISLYSSYPIYLCFFPLILFVTYRFIKNREKEVKIIKEKIKQELINHKETIVNFFHESVSKENDVQVKNIEYYYKKEEWKSIYNLIVSQLSDIKTVSLIK